MDPSCDTSALQRLARRTVPFLSSRAPAQRGQLPLHDSNHAKIIIPLPLPTTAPGEAPGSGGTQGEDPAAGGCLIAQQPVWTPPSAGQQASLRGHPASTTHDEGFGVGSLIRGHLGHAVLVAGGLLRLSTNYADPLHLLWRHLPYKTALCAEQRQVRQLQRLFPLPPCCASSWEACFACLPQLLNQPLAPAASVHCHA